MFRLNKLKFTKTLPFFSNQKKKKNRKKFITIQVRNKTFLCLQLLGEIQKCDNSIGIKDLESLTEVKLHYTTLRYVIKLFQSCANSWLFKKILLL